MPPCSPTFQFSIKPAAASSLYSAFATRRVRSPLRQVWLRPAPTSRFPVARVTAACAGCDGGGAFGRIIELDCDDMISAFLDWLHQHGSMLRTKLEPRLKNIRVLRNRDFTICEERSLRRIRDYLSADVEISTALR